MGILAKLQKTFTARGAVIAAMASTLLAFSLPSGATSPVEREYEQAVHAFRTGRTSEAFGRFVDLANRGDVDSARVALFMQSYGPALYGKQWDAGPENVAYWSAKYRAPPPKMCRPNCEISVSFALGITARCCAR